MKWTSPYNFVPINKKVYTPDWGNDVDHDIPFEDGEDGTIEVKITNVSPLFIRDKSFDKNDERTFYSCHIDMGKSGKQYLIPGSTLKGAIRNVMEVLSFAKMDRYDNQSFGYRDIGNDKTYYVKRMKNEVQCGWLQKTVEEEYLLYPCKEEPKQIKHSDIIAIFPHFYIGKDHESAEKKQKSIKTAEELFPTISGPSAHVPAGKFNVVCTGYIQKKHHEYLFSTDLKEPIKVSKEVFETFDTIHSHTEYYAGREGKGGFLKNLLENGEKIPVFFLMEEEQVQCMGIARYFRYPFSQNIQSDINQEKKEEQDLPSVIFGYINTDKKEALKGRVQIGHAFCKQTIKDEELSHTIQGVLGQPKPSFYPLYIKQKGIGETMKYDSKEAEASGRKRYRIFKGCDTNSLPQGNGNENVMTKFYPIPEGKEFTCRIGIHNLRPIEVGALLAAITFDETSGTYHNIGGAKSFGYGKIKCEISGLNGLKLSKEEYLKAFETEMSRFLYNDNKSTISQNESINTLLSIATEHNAADCEMKILKDYENYKDSKKNTDPIVSPLPEKHISLHLHFDESIIKKMAKMELYNEEFKTIEELIDKPDFDRALSLMNTLERRLNLEGLTTDKIQSYKELIEKKKEEQREELLKRANTQQDIPDNLDDFIASCTSIEALSNKLKKWKNEHDSLEQKDLQLAADKCIEILNKKPKEKKNWADIKGWKKVEKNLGPELTRTLFELVKKEL